jgi:hypothetical protein
MDKMRLKDLLAQGAFGDVLQELQGTAAGLPGRENEIVVHKGALRELEEQERAGLLGSEEIKRERARLRLSILRLIDVLDETSNSKAIGVRGPKTIAISYSWRNEPEVDAIDQAFSSRGINIIRDKRDATYRADIQAFMRRIGKSQRVILVISDNFLKSRNCMFEILEVSQQPGFENRILPVVLDDARAIYDATKSLDYLSYWDRKIEEVEKRLRKMPSLANTGRVLEELNHFQRIRSALDGLIDRIQNMNALTFKDHLKENFSSLIRESAL